MRWGKVRKNGTPRPVPAMLMLMCVACGPGTACGPKAAGGPQTPSEAQVPQAEPEAAGALEEPSDPTDPENLARAVFSALTLKDAAAYKALLPGSTGEAQELAQAMGSSQVMTDDEIAAMMDKKANKFNEFITLLESKGFNLHGAVMTDMDTHRVQVKDGLGFAEDIKLTMESAGMRAVITIDDCMLFSRGWLILDGLKLRDPIEGTVAGAVSDE
jgi:hypothetical protein